MKTKKFTRKEIVKDWKKNKLLYLMAVPLIAFLSYLHIFQWEAS